MNEEFLELLQRSNRRTRDGRSVEDLYNVYLTKINMGNRFPINDFVNEFGLEIIRESLDINISGKIEGTRITVNSNNVRKRQNFTIAHEFAHFILEHGNQVEYRANIAYTPEQKIQEEQANLFAGCILMPENLVKRAVDDFIRQNNIAMLGDRAPEIINQLSNMFDVSTASVIKRLKALGYISGWIWI